jgi:hypothetical protein
MRPGTTLAEVSHLSFKANPVDKALCLAYDVPASSTYSPASELLHQLVGARLRATVSRLSFRKNPDGKALCLTSDVPRRRPIRPQAGSYVGL